MNIFEKLALAAQVMMFFEMLRADGTTPINIRGIRYKGRRYRIDGVVSEEK